MTATVRNSAAGQVVARTPARHEWLKNPSFVAGVIILGIIVLGALSAPALTSHSPITTHIANKLQPASSHHILGTDQLGRDVWARLVYGARADLRIAFLAVLFPFVLGTALGMVAGYFGRWVDNIVMRLADIVVAFPFYVLVIALVFVLGSGARSIYVAITFVGWVSYARIVRGEVLVARNEEYVLAAKSAGISRMRIMARHLLPNVIPQAIVFAMSDIILDILAVVTLGFLGLGIQPPTPEWGQMISDGQNYITTNWLLSTIPGLAVVLTGTGLSLLGDGLVEVLEPGR